MSWLKRKNDVSPVLSPKYGLCNQMKKKINLSLENLCICDDDIENRFSIYVHRIVGPTPVVCTAAYLLNVFFIITILLFVFVLYNM